MLFKWGQKIMNSPPAQIKIQNINYSCGLKTSDARKVGPLVSTQIIPPPPTPPLPLWATKAFSAFLALPNPGVATIPSAFVPASAFLVLPQLKTQGMENLVFICSHSQHFVLADSLGFLAGSLVGASSPLSRSWERNLGSAGDLSPPSCKGVQWKTPTKGGRGIKGYHWHEVQKMRSFYHSGLRNLRIFWVLLSSLNGKL